MNDHIKDSKKKATDKKRIWAMLTNKQPGKSMAVIEKVFKNLHEDLDSDSDFRRMNASNLAMKIYTHLSTAIFVLAWKAGRQR